MVPLIADTCESWDSVPISVGELWEVFEKMPMFWVPPENSSDGWNSWVLMSADQENPLEMSIPVIPAKVLLGDPGARSFSFGATEQVPGGFWLLDPTAAHQT